MTRLYEGPRRPTGRSGRTAPLDTRRSRRFPRGASSSPRYCRPAGSERHLTIFGTDGAEAGGGGGALITESAWACAALCPPAGDLVLLANTSLVLEPDCGSVFGTHTVFSPVQRTGSIKSHPILGGLHHHYIRV